MGRGLFEVNRQVTGKAEYKINVSQLLATTANAFLTPGKVYINHLSHLINCLPLQRSSDW